MHSAKWKAAAGRPVRSRCWVKPDWALAQQRRSHAAAVMEPVELEWQLICCLGSCFAELCICTDGECARVRWVGTGKRWVERARSSLAPTGMVGYAREAAARKLLRIIIKPFRH